MNDIESVPKTTPKMLTKPGGIISRHFQVTNVYDRLRTRTIGYERVSLTKPVKKMKPQLSATDRN